MLKLIYHELVKTFFKKRTYLGFLLIALIVPLVEIAIKIEGGRFATVMMRSLQQDFFFVGSLFNGWFVAQQIMQSLWIHIPLLISFVAGDQLAGEATAGTYRLMLIRPVSRTQILFSKYCATLIYTLVFILFLAGLSIGLALALLGTGDLLVFGQGFMILSADDVAWRFLVAYIFAFWAMVTISSIAFFFSSFVENAIGPIVATMGVLIVLTIIYFLEVELFDPIRPYLFSPYMRLWSEAFMEPLDWETIRRGLLVLGSYSAASVAGAWIIFARKDVLT